MEYELVFDTAGMDWNVAAKVIELAPLGKRDPERMRRAFENSFATCFAYHHGELVGFARALSDQEYQASIFDLCVLPEHQGQGLGRMIMEALLALVDVDTVLLYSVPGKEKFYGKLGFELMATAMGRFRDHDSVRAKGYLA